MVSPFVLGTHGRHGRIRADPPHNQVSVFVEDNTIEQYFDQGLVIVHWVPLLEFRADLAAVVVVQNAVAVGVLGCVGLGAFVPDPFSGFGEVHPRNRCGSAGQLVRQEDSIDELDQLVPGEDRCAHQFGLLY